MVQEVDRPQVIIAVGAVRPRLGALSPTLRLASRYLQVFLRPPLLDTFETDGHAGEAQSHVRS